MRSRTRCWSSSATRPWCGAADPTFAVRFAAEHRALRHLHLLARYTQPDGLVREIFAFPAASGSRLVVDRLAGGLGDSRLLAHLAADEPAENAELVCRLYLADRNRGCRRLSSLDLKVAPQEDSEPEAAAGGGDLRDAGGNLYRICVPDDGRRRLRWTRRRPGQAPERGEEVSLREVVSARDGLGIAPAEVEMD